MLQKFTDVRLWPGVYCRNRPRRVNYIPILCLCGIHYAPLRHNAEDMTGGDVFDPSQRFFVRN